jgi:multidrug efflux pump subunit AcrB
MNVSAWSIRNPIPAILLFVLLTLAGIFAFRAMKIQQFMDIDLPTVTVTATLPGAAPAQMETEVARKIENSVATVQGIKHIYTKVQDGTATVTVEFRLEKPVQEAVDDVRDAVSRIRSDLPGDLRDPVIGRISVAGAPILTYTVASQRMDDEALSWFVDNTVTKAMLAVRGVGAVARVGGVTREIRVELDPARLLALNATAADISRQLRRIQQEASGGRADVGGIEQSVRTIATVQSAEELAAMDIVLSDGRRVRLDQVATVSDTVGEPRSAALLDGRPVVGFEITRSRGAGEVEVAEVVRRALEKLNAEHPDITITEAFNFVDPVIENYEGSMVLLIEGAILAVIVVWLFLRDWRATFVSATALPLSAIPTFAVMYLMGFTFNVVTALSLSLVVGILVDDAIVEIENIMRHLRMGKAPFQAAMEAADEIGLAVIATTFTLIAVFLPTAFMSGVAGKFFVQFGWTAAIAVFFSLVVARLLTPMMAAYLLKPVADKPTPGWLVRYEGWAAWCLRHRLATLSATAVFFFGSFALVPLLPTGFLPADDLSQTQVHVTLPPGATLAETGRRSRAGARHRQCQPAREDGLYGGRRRRLRQRPLHAARRRRGAQGDADLNLTPRGDAFGHHQAGRRAPAARGARRPARGQVKVGFGGSSGEKYILVLASENGAAAHRTRPPSSNASLRTLPGIGAVTTTASLVRPELVVRPDFARMPPTSASPRRPSPTRCASPPPATTTRGWRSSTWRSARCPSSSSCRPARARIWPCSRA